MTGVQTCALPIFSYTDYKEHTITRGNGNPNDDFVIRPGQTWCVVSSAVEGDTHIADGAPVVVLEDVITTGGSTLKAIEKLAARKLRVSGVVVLVDRLEGGREALEAAGVRVRSVFDRASFER